MLKVFSKILVELLYNSTKEMWLHCLHTIDLSKLIKVKYVHNYTDKKVILIMLIDKDVVLFGG